MPDATATPAPVDPLSLTAPDQNQPAQAQETLPPSTVGTGTFWPEPKTPMKPFPSMPAVGYHGRESWSAGEVGLLLIGGALFMALVARYLGLWGRRKKPPESSDAEGGRDGRAGRSGRPHRPF